MDELIRQIRAASEAGLYYLALFGALALPDICGALASDDGRASGSKYKAWLRGNVTSQAADAELIYGLRCSLLHQGSALPHKGLFPLAFNSPAPGVPQLHNLSTVVNGQQIGWLSIPLFVAEVTTAARVDKRGRVTRHSGRSLSRSTRGIRPAELPRRPPSPLSRWIELA